MSELPFKSEGLVGGGRFCDVHKVRAPDGSWRALKIARTHPREVLDVTGGVFFAEGLGFHTGSVGPLAVDPNDVIDAEIKTLARVDHPSVVPSLEDGAFGGRRWFCSPWIEGQSWRRGIYADKSVTLQSFIALVDILAELKRKGRLSSHGDIKPDNLLNDAQGKLHIIDPSSGYTQRDPLGHPSRMLLSDWYNPGLEDSDLPALGILLVEVVTSEHLWLAAEGEPAKLSAALSAQLEARRATGTQRMFSRVKNLRRPTALGCGEALEDIALRCLGLKWAGDQFDVRAPYSDVSELAADLPR